MYKPSDHKSMDDRLKLNNRFDSHWNDESMIIARSSIENLSHQQTSSSKYNKKNHNNSKQQQNETMEMCHSHMSIIMHVYLLS